MPSTAQLIAFMSAALALNVTPGPDMLYVIARSVGDGRRAGIVSALGIATGILVHVSALVLGLAAMLATAPIAFEILRWSGAAYLVWLGARMLVSSAAAQAFAATRRGSLWQVYRQGIVTAVLNPKLAAFFLAFLPQFVDAKRGSVSLQIATLGLLFGTSGTSVNIAVAFLASGATRARTALTATDARTTLLLRRVCGTVLLAIAIGLIAGHR